MKRSTRIGLGTALAVLVIGSVAEAPAAPVLLVANRSSHEVTLVDTAAGRVIARLPTGEGPHLLSNVANGRVVATGYGEFPRPHAEPVASRPPFESALNSRLTLIDVEARKVVTDTPLAGCRRPHSSWLVDGRAYVTCEDERQVLVVDAASGKEIERLDTGQAGSHVLSFDPASRVLGVSNTGSGSITLFAIDNGDRRIVALAPGSEGARVIDGRLWVANTGDGSVSIVDPEDGREQARIEDVCAFPIAFDRDAQGRVWVACFASGELVALDAGSASAVTRHAVNGHPLHMLADPQARRAWVSLPRDNAVAEIDLDSGDELRRVTVGIEPDGLRWAVAQGTGD